MAGPRSVPGCGVGAAAAAGRLPELDWACRIAALVGISHHIESLGNKDSDLVILGAFQTAAHFTAATAHRFAHLARRSPLVGALGAGLGAEPARGVRGASLGSDDALIGEWVVIAVGPTTQERSSPRSGTRAKASRTPPSTSSSPMIGRSSLMPHGRSWRGSCRVPLAERPRRSDPRGLASVCDARVMSVVWRELRP